MPQSATAAIASLALLLASGAPAPGQAATTAPIEIQTVRPGLHLLRGAGANVVAWAGTDGIVVVDSGTAASAQQLLETLGRVSPGPLRFLVNTHWHPEHVGGNPALHQAGAQSLAHADTRASMAVSHTIAVDGIEVPAAPREGLPMLTFDDAVSLHLNGDRLDVLHVAGAQGSGDVILWWEAANVVHVGDAQWPGGYPLVNAAGSGSLAGMVASIETVLSRADARTAIVPGHGPVSDRAELAAYRDMLVAVGSRVRELIEKGRGVEEVLAAHPTAPYDERYALGAVSAERFLRTLYADLTGRH